MNSLNGTRFGCPGVHKTLKTTLSTVGTGRTAHLSTMKQCISSSAMNDAVISLTSSVRSRNNARRRYTKSTAKLKDNTTVLKIFFPIQGTQLGTEYILNNMDEILRNERQKYYPQVERHFSNATEIGEDYEINKVWEERPVV